MSVDVGSWYGATCAAAARIPVPPPARPPAQTLSFAQGLVKRLLLLINHGALRPPLLATAFGALAKLQLLPVVAAPLVTYIEVAIHQRLPLARTHHHPLHPAPARCISAPPSPPLPPLPS